MTLQVREGEVALGEIFAAEQLVEGTTGVVRGAVGNGPGGGLLLGQKETDLAPRQ
jgi:hypothetical protein